MLTSITQVGSSQGLILDSALCKLTRLKAGDQVNVTVNAWGAITITPMRKVAGGEAVDNAIRHTIEYYEKSMRKLA